MRIFVSGQKAFGAAALKAILGEGHEVVGVASPAWEDEHAPGYADFRSSYRLDLLRWEAERRGIPWMDASQLRAETLPDGVDLIVAAHSHAFIGRKTREKARLGAIGYHPSLLPRHRGRDAVRWTIHMGDRVAGGTVFWLSDAVDGGPIAAQEWCHVAPGDTVKSLWRERLFPIGLRLLVKVLRQLAAGRMVRVDQDERFATWEPSWERAPLFRPELPQIGAGPEGMEVVADPLALQG